VPTFAGLAVLQLAALRLAVVRRAVPSAAQRGVPSVAPLAARPGPRVVQARRVVPHRV